MQLSRYVVSILVVIQHRKCQELLAQNVRIMSRMLTLD